ncbi:hypothetical protein PILCRDRAFT_596121 [Piloderma croceum F 1598]|uniref:Uncharacterized protein n=1 Tax=Piloderma croceum (strain F 1598) TaxID=765440 RepID=A0A0C3AWG5_PILCF|nr:hypothetical protein PILCRDRAFT_596121 [Piloderma croceum F 1598]
MGVVLRRTRGISRSKTMRCCLSQLSCLAPAFDPIESLHYISQYRYPQSRSQENQSCRPRQLETESNQNWVFEFYTMAKVRTDRIEQSIYFQLRPSCVVCIKGLSTGR